MIVQEIKKTIKKILPFNFTQNVAVRPKDKHAALSDLFAWRCDSEWKTELCLYNISSYIFPDLHPKEDCQILFFDSKGKKIHSTTIVLEPLELKRIDLSLITSLQGYGSFAVFHYSECNHLFVDEQSHIIERGYVSYSTNNSSVKSYCHGNMHALSKSKHQDLPCSIVAASKNNMYHPQLILCDTDKFELVYTNPSLRTELLDIHFLDENSSKVSNIKVQIEPLGTYVREVSNRDRKIATLKSYSNIFMWRPLVFKYYATYFDVLHS